MAILIKSSYTEYVDILSPITDKNFADTLNDLRQQFAAMHPMLELTISDPTMNVEGYVVVWNTDICKDGPLFTNGKGCGKGGTRIKADLTLHDVRRLARAMAEKNAAAGLPMGGAKSGLRADPDSPDYEQKFRRFVQLVKERGILYEDGGIFGGFGYDIGGRPPYNALWAVDTLGSGKSFTGKPLTLGGTDYEREGIAGMGVAIAAKTLLRVKKQKVKGTSFSVQGVGAMGSAVIRYFTPNGPVLKSISDPKYGGTWRFENGASAELITFLAEQNGPEIFNCLKSEGYHVSNDPTGALYEDVDVIFPCALEDSLTADNAGKVKARYIVEGANNPTTDAAHEIFYQNGIFVVPDILANAGGIIAAFVEMTSIKANKTQEAKTMAKHRIADNVKELLTLSAHIHARPDQIADYMTYRNIFKRTEEVMHVR